ncbi:hypothetical protein ES332_D11G152900v1 [Gossypium tomentosum]|uniref:Uncharacterized protein n=1 Tax=Gossypium tomentosum TaxID=34277 RepID=A0A5D2IMZ3_GOSTO|nr:hypothetical protein ES332_D11G152900v1 [Gossypium tomentosum]
MAIELGVGKILISCLAGRLSLKLRQYDYLQYMLGGFGNNKSRFGSTFGSFQGPMNFLWLVWREQLQINKEKVGDDLQGFLHVQYLKLKLKLYFMLSEITERPYEASLFLGIGFGPFLRSLGGRRIGPPSGGPEPSVRYHFGRARVLTLCQDLRAKGQSQVDSFYEA